MKSSAVVGVMAAMAVAVACLAAEPAAAQAHNTNRYGRQQLAQKQNRYGNTAWSSGRAAAGWYGGTMMRHYPVSTGGRYLQTAAMGRQGDDYGYDAADLQGGDYDPRPYDRLQDYAVVRYPSYGGGGAGLSAGGYYSQSVADQLYDEDLRLQQAYEDAVFGGHGGRGDPVAAAYSSSPYYSAAAAYNRYRPAAPVTVVRPYDAMMAGPPPARYHHPPTDKIHKFRKVFMSNLVSPSNAFKSTKEQQLYDFWESLINGDLDQDSDPDSGAAPQQQYSRDDRQSLLAGDDSSSLTSQLYQHLPPIFQQLQQQQKLKQQRASSSSSSSSTSSSSSPSSSSSSSSSPVDQDRKSSSYAAYSSSLPPSASSASSSSSAAQQTVPRGNLYKQWANGSPLIKRSSSSSSSSSSSADVRTPRPAASATTDNEDVRQLEELKTDNAARARNTTGNNTVADVTANAVADDDGDDAKTAVVTSSSSAAAAAAAAAVVATPLMADGGQREYVLPRPAGEKSGFESLLEVIAEGGLHGNVDKNTAAAYRKLHQEAKVNKKRSYVSDETSLAAQLGALRKN